jgi:uncharacterized protein with GYD domain
MPLPKFLEPFLPSYDISKMDLKDPYDKKLIIEAVLNQGTMKEIKWLFKTYSVREIKNVLKNPRRGSWDARVLNYWTKILDIKIPKIIYDVAIFSLEPRPKLMMRYFNYLKRKGKVPKETLRAWREIDKLEKLAKSKQK